MTDLPANLDLDILPLSGALFLRLAPCPLSLALPGLWFLGASLSPSSVLSAPGCLACSAHSPQLLMEAHHSGAPGAWLRCLSAHCNLPSPLPLARSAFFAPFFWCSVPPPCLMSRGDELRQLAAQLSVLAALEDSIALGLSRVMGPAGSGRSAGPPDAGSPSVPAATAAPSVVPSPGHEVAASLLRSATLTSASSRARTRSPAPLPKRAPRRVARLLSRSRDWSRAWPPRAAHQSRLLSCAYPASLALSTPLQSARRHLLTPPGPLHPQPRLLRPPVPRSPRPIPMPIGTLSLTHTVSPRLLVAPRPPSPSRLSPLELVGVLATSVAVASAKPPSAPCGGIFNVLSPVLCAFSAGVASLAVGFVLGTCTRPRVMGEVLVDAVFSCGSGAGLGLLLALQTLVSWTSPPCPWVWRLQVVS